MLSFFLTSERVMFTSLVPIHPHTCYPRIKGTYLVCLEYHTVLCLSMKNWYCSNARLKDIIALYFDAGCVTHSAGNGAIWEKRFSLRSATQSGDIFLFSLSLCYSWYFISGLWRAPFTIHSVISSMRAIPIRNSFLRSANPCSRIS